MLAAWPTAGRLQPREVREAKMFSWVPTPLSAKPRDELGPNCDNKGPGRVRRDQPEQRFPMLGARAWAEAREGREGATVAHIGGREGGEGRVSEYDVWRHAAASHCWH